jgi:drug/metabolite transporter (DMT)-like permease
LGNVNISLRGVVLAVLSGSLASGVGYVVWYAALRGLTATHAAVAQLSAPVIAALGGIAIMSEPLTLRFVVSTALVLGGIAAAVLVRRARPA